MRASGKVRGRAVEERWRPDVALRLLPRPANLGEQDGPQSVFKRHHLKGAKERSFSDVLSGMDLHHPPCQNLIANQAFYALGMLAHNLLVSLRVLDCHDDQQS